MGAGTKIFLGVIGAVGAAFAIKAFYNYKVQAKYMDSVARIQEADLAAQAAKDNARNRTTYVGKTFGPLFKK